MAATASLVAGAHALVHLVEGFEVFGAEHGRELASDLGVKGLHRGSTLLPGQPAELAASLVGRREDRAHLLDLGVAQLEALLHALEEAARAMVTSTLVTSTLASGGAPLPVSRPHLVEARLLGLVEHALELLSHALVHLSLTGLALSLGGFENRSHLGDLGLVELEELGHVFEASLEARARAPCGELLRRREGLDGGLVEGEILADGVDVPAARQSDEADAGEQREEGACALHGSSCDGGPVAPHEATRQILRRSEAAIYLSI